MTPFGYELIAGAVVLIAVAALAYRQSRPKPDDADRRAEFVPEFAAVTAPAAEMSAPAPTEPPAAAATPTRKRKPKKPAKKRRARAS